LSRLEVAALRRRGDRVALPIALNGLAWLLVQHGDLQAATRAADDALSMLSETDKIIWEDTLHTVGAVAFAQGRVDQAGVCFSLSLATGMSFSAQLPYNLEGLALTAAASGRPLRALRLFAAGASARRAGGRRGDPWWARMCEETMTAARDQLSPARAATATAEGARLTAPDAVRYALRDQWVGAGQGTDSPLTTRELEVARLVASGLTNAQIAARLGVSARTVVNHLEHIRTKLDVHTRTQVAAWTTRRYPPGA
jgi:DNA-binding CsgD family transcriptional regulator